MKFIYKIFNYICNWFKPKPIQTPSRSPIKVILAGNYEQAVTYARKNHWTINEWRYIVSPHSILGYNSIELYKIGTWHRRPDLKEIMEELSQVKTIKKLKIIVPSV